jgi:hypothetical protein
MHSTNLLATTVSATRLPVKVLALGKSSQASSSQGPRLDLRVLHANRRLTLNFISKPNNPSVCQ